MKKYVIDGLFLLNKITGMERYCIEILKELDKITSGINITLIIPKNSNINLNNIKIITINTNCKLVFWLYYQYLINAY